MKKKILLFAILLIQAASVNAQSPGNSLNFDGTNDYVSATLPTVFSNIVGNDLTIETWIKPEGAAFQRIVYAQLDANNFVTMTIGSGNTIFFYVNNLSIANESTSALVGSQWSHVACTWNANTQEVQIYINGVLDVLVSGGSSSTGTNNIMTIGSRTDGNQYFTGELDELRIWDDLRTVCEINGSMNSEYTVAQPNLVAYYNFNQGVAGAANAGITTLPDFSTNYDGTLLNFALTGATSNWETSGAVITQVNQNSTASSTDVQSACITYDWIDGNTYTASNNVATFTYVGGAANGCDSIVTLDLTINTVDVTVTTTDPSITSNAVGAVYQWLDCNNSYAIVNGETAQGFTATANGDYAVEVTENGCTDTSACVNIATVGLDENALFANVSIFPNPNQGTVNVDLSDLQGADIKVFSANGQLLYESENIKSEVHQFEFNEAPGMYFVEVSAQGQKQQFKLVKK